MKVVTIVTVVFNGAKDIEQTIQSVLLQQDSLLEYIIIDGHSTDSTLAIVEKYKDNIDVIVSEPDRGIYDAMNKGVSLASGKFICFINSGDTLKQLPWKELQECDNTSLLCFPVSINHHKIKQPVLGWKFKVTNTLPHQGIFYKREVSLKYDLTYQVFSDYALNADYFLSNKRIEIFDSPVVANHNLDGISNNRKSSRELFRMIRDKFGVLYMSLSFLYFKIRGMYYRVYNACY